MPLHQRLPVLPIPLRKHERALPLDLQALVERVYEAGRYEVIDYGLPPEPPLPVREAAWVAEVIRAADRQ